MDYIIIKLSDKREGKLDPPNINDPEAIKERASGDWKTTLATLFKSRRCLALYRGLILKEYKIEDSITLIYEKKRIKLHLTEIENSKYVGKFLIYKTSYPISVLNSDNFVFDEEKNN